MSPSLLLVSSLYPLITLNIRHLLYPTYIYLCYLLSLPLSILLLLLLLRYSTQRFLPPFAQKMIGEGGWAAIAYVLFCDCACVSSSCIPFSSRCVSLSILSSLLCMISRMPQTHSHALCWHHPIILGYRSREWTCNMERSLLLRRRSLFCVHFVKGGSSFRPR